MITGVKNKIINDFENKNYVCPECGRTGLRSMLDYDQHRLVKHGIPTVKRKTARRQ